MRNLKSILFATIFALAAISCSKNEDPITQPVESKKIENLHAPQTTDYTVRPPVTSGEFTKFSFKEGKKTTGDNWDIAFRGTTILVNGGTVIGITDEPARKGNASLALENGTFSGIIKAPEEASFKQDATGVYALPTGSNNGWYSYAGPPTHAINPIAGKVLVIKTIDGNYAKVEILSYYKDNTPSQANSRYYTFNYVYNPNKGDKNFK